MKKSVDYLEDQLRGFHTANVSPSMIGSIRMNYYGQMTPLQHLANIGQKERRISIQVHEPSMADAVVKSLTDSSFNAYRFSKQVVVIDIPAPSGEQTEKAIKYVKKLGEDAKVAVRNLRKKFKKFDDVDGRELQTITSQHVDEIDNMIKHRIKEMR